MEYKAKYQGKTKKLLAKKVTSLATLRQVLKGSFPDVPNDFIVCYYDDNDNLDLQSEDDFQLMIQSPKKVILYLRHQGQSPNDSSMDASFALTNKNNIIPQNLKEVSKTESISKKETPIQISTEKQASPLKGNRQPEKLKKETVDPGIKADGTKTKLKVQQLKAAQPKQKQTEFIAMKRQQSGPKRVEMAQPLKDQFPTKINPQSRKPKPNAKYTSFECIVCKKRQKGLYWKCSVCLDYSFCNDCYEKKKYQEHRDHKGHRIMMIEDDSFWQRINFAHPIRKIFNPSYKRDDNDLKLGQWITQEDMTHNSLKFVNEVWRSSQGLANRITQDFDQWLRENGNAQ